MPALHAVVGGRVQGVGFRYYVHRCARELGLKGWVQNLADGTVEVWAEGPAAALDSLLEALRRGPMGSRVTGVHADHPEREQGYAEFAVR
jgi:acylphosphatase